MQLRKKRRETEIFSLSFMDCICCGFGAVLLIFILTTGQKVDFSQQTLEELKLRVRQLEIQITDEKAELDKASKSTVTEVQLQQIISQNAADEKKVTEEKEQLALMLERLAQMQKEMEKLLDLKKTLPKEDDQPLPIPDIDRRQYLTGVRLEGERVLFLLRASGSMLGESIDDAVARLQDPEFKKREAPKWQRVVRSIEWMISQLAPEQSFQVLVFNDETKPLVPGNDWIRRDDKTAVRDALGRLRQLVPQGSANLERAFSAVRFLPQLPDAIVLLTDGLPTDSDTAPNPGDADDDARIRYFRYAQRQLPTRIPVSTILYPMTGDPGAPALYWELAGSTRGALVSPSATWPES